MFDKLRKKYKVLITASGLSPVGINTNLSLKGKVRKVVGIDITESYAREISNNYYLVPLANSSNYISTILDICRKENIDTVLPLTIEETLELKKVESEFNKLGIFIANSNSIENINICNDKYLTNAFLKKSGVIVPSAYNVSNIDEIRKIAQILGYPERDVVFKPRITHGSRGFRIITNSYNKLNLLLHCKPTDNVFLTLQELLVIIGNSSIDAVLMDKLEGDDYSVYCFSINGEALIIVPMKRSGLIPGMSTGGEIIENKEIIKYASEIITALKLSGSINIQLKLTSSGPLLYEINSRISATTVITRACGLNFPYYEILLAHSEHNKIKEMISKASIIWGTKMTRIYKEVYNNHGNYFSL